MFNETKGDLDSQYIENNSKRELEKNNFSLENNFNSNEYNNSLKDRLSPYKKIDENVILNGNFENKRDGLKNLDSYNINPNKEISQNNKIDKDAILDSNLEKHDSESPVIEIKCRNEELEGKKHPETGVSFERKTVQDANGNDVEVVVPKFESEFDVKLPENLEQESDKKQFDSLIQYMNNKGTYNLIRFTGGEALTNPNIYDYIKYAISLGVSVSLATNGTLINKSIAKKLKDTGLRKCVISIDGTEKANDKIRGEGTFQKAMNAIKCLKENNISVRINSVVMKNNIEDIIELSKLFNNLKIKMYIRRFVNSGGLKI